MISLNFILHLTSLVACSALVLLGMFNAINGMSKDTCHPVRFAWVFITTAAMGGLLGELYGHQPASIVQISMEIGVALYLFMDRRTRRERRQRRRRIKRDNVHI